MIKNIIDNIVLAERQAENIGREAAKRAQEIRIEANNKAEEYLETAKKEIKDAVRQIMLKASAEGEAKAAETLLKSRAAHAAAAETSKNEREEAVCRIITGFLNSNNL